ncbi:hypothetical protein BRADI_2g09585v3 [Brachypodium distachyon]|uniref:Uncharacterized protein n=1 Tax=Brachypodium distachyon TaxID=15368 RepID=A0A0Q3FWI3_BRADI|nr:hypothetical protein BRADI_2g09585v3 [Brachypodium distachyon]
MSPTTSQIPSQILGFVVWNRIPVSPIHRKHSTDSTCAPRRSRSLSSGRFRARYANRFRQIPWIRVAAVLFRRVILLCKVWFDTIWLTAPPNGWREGKIYDHGWGANFAGGLCYVAKSSKCPSNLTLTCTIGLPNGTTQ